MRPHSVDTLVMNTERFWFFYRVKQKIEPSWILRRSVVTTMSSKLGLTRGRCNREKYRNTRSEWERWRRKTDLNDRKEKENYGTEVSGKQMNRRVWYNDYYRYSNVKSLSRYGTPFSWKHSSPRLREKLSLLCLFLRFFLCWENFPVRQDLTNSGLFLFITALVIDVRRFTMYITLGAWYDKLRLLHWIKNGIEEKKCVLLGLPRAF